MTEVELVVETIGAQGDGIATGPDGARVFVPFGAPGDRVRARVEDGRATILSILSSGEARVPALCRHFGSCGGCAIQHVSTAFAADWKRRIVAASLGHRGLDPDLVAPTRAAAPHARRRVTFQARREGRALRFGFAARGSHRLVDIAECPILVPSLAALAEPLRALADDLVAPRAEARFLATATESGIDLVVETKARLDLALRERLAALAESLDLARLSWGADEIVLERRPPVVAFGAARVVPPPGAFLQPSVEGEAILASLVEEGLAGATRVADLFAGCGTFALRLAARASVAAFEGEPRMVAALLNGTRGALGLKPVSAERRDLFRRPLDAIELGEFDGIVIDPPRAGAAAQAAALADATGPRRLVMVSCNPATFARDARTLVDGGWRLEGLVPVDQFAFSSHVELVARFTRGS